MKSRSAIRQAHRISLFHSIFEHEELFPTLVSTLHSTWNPMWPRVCFRDQCWVHYFFYYIFTISQRLWTVLGHLSDYLQMMLFSIGLFLVNLTVKVFRPSYAEWLIELNLGNCGSMLANAHQLHALLKCKTPTGLNPHLLKILCPCMSFLSFKDHVSQTIRKANATWLSERHTSVCVYQ